MCRLTRREREVLEKLMVADVQVTASELGVTPATIYVMRGRVRGKIEMAKDFLKQVKKYKRALGTSRYDYT